MGMLAVDLKDAPIDEVAELNVYIVGLTVKPAEGPVVRIAEDVGLVDLLQLQSTTQLLVLTPIEPGPYTFIRVDLDQEQSSVVEVGGAVRPLQIASQEIKVNGGFEVLPADQTRLTLDFDAAQSLQKKGNGDWLLVPVIIQEKVETD